MKYRQLLLVGGLILPAACAGSWADRTSHVLQAALTATNAARDSLLQASQAAQEAIVEQAEDQAKAIPASADLRNEKVADIKEQARAKLRELRAKRDQAARALHTAYMAIARATLLLAAAEETPDTKAKVLQYMREASEALREAAR